MTSVRLSQLHGNCSGLCVLTNQSRQGRLKETGTKSECSDRPGNRNERKVNVNEKNNVFFEH